MREPAADLLGELELLRNAVRGLTERVYRLEQTHSAVEPLSKTSEPLEAIRSQEVSEPLSAAAFHAEPLPSAAAATPPPPIRPSPPPPPRGLQPNLESQIGAHWLNRIGIAAMLSGAVYFLKYAFDNNWIGPAGRVAIGLLAGIAVVAWSEWFRGRGYKAFSYSLKAVGIGTLYLSLWAAFQIYALIPSGLAFFAMFIVTAATGIMAWSQDAEILAAFALSGGFATPLLLSTGQNREFELFSYVALLDLAALALVVLRPWRKLLLMSFTGTLLLYCAWYFEYYHRPEFALTAAFATLFFVIFAAAPIFAKIPRARAGTTSALPIFLGFVNAGVYFLQMYVMLEQIDKSSSA